MEKISIIVPVYNVEKYIAKCLDSLVKQTYDNYDVLVVNDGSPSNEQTIIDEYIKKYPNIIKSIVKENGGYGSVLELAFNANDSEYVLVCDPDDYLDDNALSTLMEYRNKYDADLVVGAKNLVYEDNEEIKYDPSFNSEIGVLKDGEVYKRNEASFEKLFFFEPSPHAKLYKRAIVKDIKFPHKVSYTDTLLYFYALNKVDKVTYCEKPLSYYLINRSGNTRTDLKPKVIDDYVCVLNNLLKQTKNPLDIFYFRMFEAFYYIFYRVDNINADENTKLDKYNSIYLFLKELIPYKNIILKYNDKYYKDSVVMINQKKKLLSIETSRSMYNSLVKARLNKTLKSKLKSLFRK